MVSSWMLWLDCFWASSWLPLWIDGRCQGILGLVHWLAAMMLAWHSRQGFYNWCLQRYPHDTLSIVNVLGRLGLLTPAGESFCFASSVRMHALCLPYEIRWKTKQRERERERKRGEQRDRGSERALSGFVLADLSGQHEQCIWPANQRKQSNKPQCKAMQSSAKQWEATGRNKTKQHNAE